LQAKLKNVGKIVAHYSLGKCNSPLGQKFTFEPDHGTLQVGEEQDIEIRFTPDSLGPFLTNFEWNLEVPITISNYFNIFLDCCESGYYLLQRDNVGPNFLLRCAEIGLWNRFLWVSERKEFSIQQYFCNSNEILP
jgi:hypothetical protein